MTTGVPAAGFSASFSIMTFPGLAQCAEVNFQGRKIGAVVAHMVQLNHHHSSMRRGCAAGFRVCSNDVAQRIRRHRVVEPTLHDLASFLAELLRPSLCLSAGACSVPVWIQLVQTAISQIARAGDTVICLALNVLGASSCPRCPSSVCFLCVAGTGRG